jgi:hypothetical protein
MMSQLNLDLPAFFATPPKIILRFEIQVNAADISGARLIFPETEGRPLCPSPAFL